MLPPKSDQSRYRYCQRIRSYLKVTIYSTGGEQIIRSIITKVAHTMSNPADLINVAIEELIQQRFELPAFSTLNRLVSHIQQSVHNQLYQSILVQLSTEQRKKLEDLLHLEKNQQVTGFTSLKTPHSKPTLKRMNNWIKHHQWLIELINVSSLLKEIAHTKIEQFAAQAYQMEL